MASGKYDEIKAWQNDVASLEKLNNMFLDALDELAAKNSDTPTKAKNTDNIITIGEFKFSKKISFEEQVNDALDGKLNRRNALYVSETPVLLQKIGMQQLPMLYTQKHLNDAMKPKSSKNSHYHGLTKEQILKMPDIINNPAIIVDSIIRNDSVVLLSEYLDDYGNPLLVSVQPNGSGVYELQTVSSNFITSYYGRNNDFSKFVENCIDANAVLYINKEKSRSLYQQTGLQLPGGFNKLGYDKIIHQSNNIVNNNSMQKSEKNTTTKSTKRDTEYMTAVNNGDTATAQRMVDEAAKATGYTYKLFHQTENDFTVFDTNHKGAGTGDYETPFGIFMKPSDSNIGLKGQKQMPLYAKIENPLVVHNRESLMHELNDVETVTDVQNKIKEANSDYKSRVEQAGKDLQNYLIEYRKSHPDEPRSDIYKDKGFNEIYDREDSLIEEWSATVDELALEAKTAITEYLKNNGYDGVIIEEDVGSFGRKTKTYIALDNTQVKSADTVTYDNDGNVIPLSERFNEKQEDIRYSRKRLTNQSSTNYTISRNSPLSSTDRAKPNPRSSINWVYQAGLFSVVESKLFHQKISEINQGSQAFRKDADGNYMLPIENKIVFTDGNYDAPEIIKIVEFMSDSETNISNARRLIYRAEKGESSYEETRQILEDLFGYGFVYQYNIGDDKAYEWANERSEGRNRRTVIANYYRMQNRESNFAENENLQDITPSTKRDASISEEASDYILDTKEYQEILDIVDQRFEATGRKELSPKAIDRLAGKLLTKSKSNYSREQLIERLTALFDFIANSRDVTWEEVTELAANIAKDMLNESQTLDRSMLK